MTIEMLSASAGNRGLLSNVHPEAWTNPRPADKYNLVILGGGYAGILTAREAVRAGAKVALVERNLLGGVCLNAGCISSKAMIRTSRLYAEMRNAGRYGAQRPDNIHVDFAEVMERMRRVRSRVSRRTSARELKASGVDVFFGEARFTGPDAITVNGETLRFKRALIAAGARPAIPSIPGLEDAGYLTNETVFELNECPPNLVVIGGGPLGCEMAQAFCRLGSHVSLVQDEPLFLDQEERDAAQILSEALARDGINIHLNTETVGVRTEGTRKLVDLISDGNKTTVVADAILLAAGRAPNVQGMNLEAAGVNYSEESGIRINDFLETSNPRIYAAGDVCLEHKFAHIEGASAQIVTQNALFFGRFRLSALTIPWCTYTDPEIAHVGMYVREAREKGIAVKTLTVPMHDVDRAMADAEEEGFVKIHIKEGTDRILGATVVARHAGELIGVISMAISAGVGLRKLGHVSYPYPTQAAAIKMACNAYRDGQRSKFRAWWVRKWLEL
ncbi:MAG TPA: mercuric reductase [Bryobacteraceae bacterium]|jgi:pyruvate/2-oxoglutarate dehydrogenase complex dihydrolipoamide dehydrogenase (E3) component|nr:mercuric reductase [Bryobacteraceae bacterium]